MDKLQNADKLIIIAGPTAVGKSDLGVELAVRMGGEIISADSMQVYKHMDIGTAKITEEEMRGVPHHMIDIIEPVEPYHVYDFKQRAQAACKEIYGRGHIPIIVGGTGFYIQALLYDIEFSGQGQDDEMRAELQAIADEQGPEALHRILAELDPDTAATLHPNNVKRTIRAIEYARQNSDTIYEHNAEQRKRISPYDFRFYLLDDDRQAVYERIDARVDRMIKAGLEDEVRGLQDMGCKADMTSMQGIGYKQMLMYIDGEISLDEAIRLIKRDSRHYAKRQLTWFRRERDIIRMERMGRSTAEIADDIMAGMWT
ncbi:MAG: tRNA (adenosine(37)-N6)-dimethylallyltransferase MiaA [Lachnospiraceae bacterium]|nr:tRNA (adenosine(37)-N6)-dimethylallyltransferase MiaA [Lachnospiraceae bacterium]